MAVRLLANRGIPVREGSDSRAAISTSPICTAMG